MPVGWKDRPHYFAYFAFVVVFVFAVVVVAAALAVSSQRLVVAAASWPVVDRKRLEVG